MTNNLDESVIIDQSIIAAFFLHDWPADRFPSELTEEAWQQIAQIANNSLKKIGIDGVQVDKPYILETIWGLSEEEFLDDV
jgi:hypothetical protein